MAYPSLTKLNARLTKSDCASPNLSRIDLKAKSKVLKKRTVRIP
ncbi:hypothetical protein Hanom_Chr03g00208171 [Helianthus anomalus]